MIRVAALALTCTLLAEPLAARTPCVGNLFETDLEGAVEVERRFADVPSARFAGLWQEGRVGGLVYRIASDRTGMVADEVRSPGWRIDIRCDLGESGCHRAQTGRISDAAQDLADRIASCILGDSPSSENLAGASADPVIASSTRPLNELAAPPPPDADTRLAGDRAIGAAGEKGMGSGDAPAGPIEASAPPLDEIAALPPPDTATRPVENRVPEPAEEGAAGPGDAPAAPANPALEGDAAGLAFGRPAGSAHVGTATEGGDAPRLAIAPVTPRGSTPAGPAIVPVSGSLPMALAGACCAPWPVDTGNQVRTLQVLLAEAGFDAGRIDGEMGPRTRAALVAALGPEGAGLAPGDAVVELAGLRCAGD